ncbi:hypothetical protein BV898_18965 [Hypsibius exemplaris]|uniref:Uncharacterized protein n=1 Tax=Hypsibius exemplaris TaxID=2072580 RepID=A0A9X6NIE1_HYPEX|nr:hypothetical protein BV898_18965 [Hypsibius exemplaris]
MKSHHPLLMITTILVTAMLSLQPVLTMISTPSTRINGIRCAEMKQAGPRSEKDEKQIKQPIHIFYYCDADSTWLRKLDNTTTRVGNILINLDGPEIFEEDPQDNATEFQPGNWYPQAVLENVRLSVDVYCCSSLVSSRDCSRGFELVYGDKTSPLPVTAAVSETSPSTDATTEAPTDMTTMLTSSQSSMTSPQTGGITAQQSNDGWIPWVGSACSIVFIVCFVYCTYRCRRDSINTHREHIYYDPVYKSE